MSHITRYTIKYNYDIPLLSYNYSLNGGNQNIPTPPTPISTETSANQQKAIQTEVNQAKPVDTANMIQQFEIPADIIPPSFVEKAKKEATNKFFKSIISKETLAKITNKTEMMNTVIRYSTYTVKVGASTAAEIGTLGAGGDTIVDGVSLIIQYLDFAKLIASIISETMGGLSWLGAIWNYCSTPGNFANGPEGIRAFVSDSFQKEKESQHPNFIIGLCTLIDKILTKISAFFGDILSFAVPDDGGVVSVVVQETIQQIKNFLSPYDVVYKLYNLMPSFMTTTMQNYDKLVTMFNTILDYLISLVTALYYVNDTAFDYIFHPFRTAGSVISGAFGIVGKVGHAVFHPIETTQGITEAVVGTYKVTAEGITKAKNVVSSKANEEYKKFKESSPLAKAGIIGAVGVGFAMSPIIIGTLPFLVVQGFATSQQLIIAGKIFGVNRDSCLRYINEDLRKRIPGLVQLMQGVLGFVFAILTIIDECGSVQKITMPGKK